MVLHDSRGSPVTPPCDDHPPNFSFMTGVCTTSSVYPSPPSTDSKTSVPLPQSTFGGILDSPVVLTNAPATLLSPPPTIPTLTLDLPCSDPSSSVNAEKRTPSPPQTQLLSPISPEWPSNRKAEDDLFDEPSGSVLLGQPFGRDYAVPTAETSLSPLGINEAVIAPLDLAPFIEDDPIPLRTFSLPLSPASSTDDESFASPLFFPPSPAPSWRKLEEEDGLGLGIVSGSPSWLQSSPSLLSFASLPSSDLDDLDLEMDIGSGLGMFSSPSRRSVADLPLFDENEYDDETIVVDGDGDVSLSPPEMQLLTVHPNALFLELPPEPVDPNPLDAYTAEELSARLPANLPPEELDALLAVRSRAHATLAECAAAAPSASSGSTFLDHEWRRSVPRDAGEPRRRRKRAKELGKEADTLIGFALGILPDSASSNVPDKRAGDDARATVRRDKAGLVGLTSLPQLVARMILRRRDRCVRGLDGTQSRLWMPSPLAHPRSLDQDDEPDVA